MGFIALGKPPKYQSTPVMIGRYFNCAYHSKLLHFAVLVWAPGSQDCPDDGRLAAFIDGRRSHPAPAFLCEYLDQAHGALYRNKAKQQQQMLTVLLLLILKRKSALLAEIVLCSQRRKLILLSRSNWRQEGPIRGHATHVPILNNNSYVCKQGMKQVTSSRKPW